MARKFLYLINPISGTGNKFSLADIIKKESSRRAVKYELLDTNAAGDYSFLPAKISQEGITDVVICGGDGTINAITANLLGSSVNVGIIPRGSGNGLALTAHIPRHSIKALDVIFDGIPSFINGFFINEHFSCMLCGIGFDAQVAHDFAQQKRRGLQTYIKVAAINFFSAKPHPFEIEADHHSISTEAFFVSIANSNQFGNNFTIAPKANLADGLLDIVVVNKMNKLVLPFSLFGQITGINATQDISQELHNRNIIYFQTSALTILNEGGAPLHIDGDPKPTATRFDIRIVDRAFRLIQPA